MRCAIRAIVALVALFVGCSTAPMFGDERPSAGLAMESTPHWNGMRVGLDVVLDGKAMPAIVHQGKMYLPVPRMGTEYELRVWNYGPNRVVAIVSVDGLSVINGRPASADQTGYVVASRSHIDIKGWRRDLESVAAFSFEERGKSYASRVGRSENIGVIGLIAIEEMVVRPLPVDRRFAEAKAAQSPAGLIGGTGTGYGREIDSRAYYVPFTRSSNKRAITFYYDTIENLRRAGVPVDRPVPNPFPGDSEFVSPPPRNPGQ